MATRSERIPLATPFSAQVDDIPYDLTRRLRVGAFSRDGFVTLLSLEVTDSTSTAYPFGATRETKAELLRKVIEHATVQLATLELEKD